MPPPICQAVLEAARACSNVSRVSEAARACLVSAAAVPRLLPLLVHDSTELACTACGVLLNLAGGGAGRDTLLASGGPGALVAALAHAWGSREPFSAPLCALLCKTLHNGLGGSAGGGGFWLSAADCVHLLPLLADVVECGPGDDGAGSADWDGDGKGDDGAGSADWDGDGKADDGADADADGTRAHTADLVDVAGRLRAAVLAVVAEGLFREEDPDGGGGDLEPL
jgi:hypothetical protein